MDIVISGRKLTGSANTAKSTYNFSGATQAEVEAFFAKLTEGSGSVKTITTTKGTIIRAELGAGEFIQLRNFATSGGDLTIEFKNSLVNGTAREIKFYY